MLKVGVTGAGSMGNCHCLSYEEIKDAKVVAIADLRLEKAQKLAAEYGAQAYNDTDQLLRKKDIDLVDICLPTPFHKEYVFKAARVGKHILCEKPIARSMAEAKEMVEICKKSGVKFMVGHVVRFYQEFAKAKELVDNGAIGKSVMVRMSRCGGFPRTWKDWYAKEKMSGGVILDMIIHDFDFLRWCFGEVERVYAKGLIYKKLEYIDYALVTLRFRNSVIAHVEGSWAHPTSFRTKLEISGTEGLLDFDSQLAAPITISLKKESSDSRKVEISESPVDESPCTKEIRHFIDCIQEDKEPLITGQDALGALEISLAALESVRSGKPVYLEKESVSC